jgi:hypothetical protein
MQNILFAPSDGISNKDEKGGASVDTLGFRRDGHVGKHKAVSDGVTLSRMQCDWYSHRHGTNRMFKIGGHRIKFDDSGPTCPPALTCSCCLKANTCSMFALYMHRSRILYSHLLVIRLGVQPVWSSQQFGARPFAHHGGLGHRTVHFNSFPFRRIVKFDL